MSSPESATTFKGLLDAAHAGSVEALAKLLKNFERVIRARIRHLPTSGLPPWITGSDLVQDMFLIAQESMPHCRAKTREEFLAWILAILQNHLGHLFRHYHTAKRGPEPRADAKALEQAPAPRPLPVEEAIRHDEIGVLLHLVAQLPERYRDVLTRVARGDNTGAIAQDLSLSPDAVRQLRARAAQALRTLQDQVLRGGDDLCSFDGRRTLNTIFHGTYFGSFGCTLPRTLSTISRSTPPSFR